MHIFGPYTDAVISHNTIWGDHLDSQLALRQNVAPGTKVEGNAIYRFWTDTDASKADFRDNTLCRLEGEWPKADPACRSTAPRRSRTRRPTITACRTGAAWTGPRRKSTTGRSSGGPAVLFAW